MWVTHELSMIATGKAEFVGTDCRGNLLTDYMNSFQKDLTIQGCAQVLESASEITFLLLLILLAKVNSIFVYDKTTFVPLQMLFFYVYHPSLAIAQGYTVTRARLRQWSAIKVTFWCKWSFIRSYLIHWRYILWPQVTVFVCAYSIMYAGLFLAERLYFDPGKVILIM